MMPRRITIFLAAPPGDSIRPAREHFHEYIKPILVAGALDWEVVEGRREGEVRAGLAEKIRKLRKRYGEVPQQDSTEESEDDLVKEVRQKSGISEWDGAAGDLVLGRHTWKEYVRGLHEGWLGPLDQLQAPEPQEADTKILPTSPEDSPSTDTISTEAASDVTPPAEPVAPDPPPPKPSKPTPIPPYIIPADYPSHPTSPSLPSQQSFLSLPLPLPHLLGFFHTPTRVYRFLTRRRLADSTGQSVAALVLASQYRPYTQSTEYVSAIDPEDASPSADASAEEGAVAQAKQTWEQEGALKQEEREWHKSAWKANEEGSDKERVWQEPMVIDDRIGQRMRIFELESGEEEKATKLEEQNRRDEQGYLEKVKDLIGWKKAEKKGWEMGLEGDESD